MTLSVSIEKKNIVSEKLTFTKPPLRIMNNSITNSSQGETHSDPNQLLIAVAESKRTKLRRMNNPRLKGRIVRRLGDENHPSSVEPPRSRTTPHNFEVAIINHIEASLITMLPNVIRDSIRPRR